MLHRIERYKWKCEAWVSAIIRLALCLRWGSVDVDMNSISEASPEGLLRS